MKTAEATLMEKRTKMRMLVPVAGLSESQNAAYANNGYVIAGNYWQKIIAANPAECKAEGAFCIANGCEGVTPCGEI